MRIADPDITAALQNEGREAFRKFGEDGESECPYPAWDETPHAMGDSNRSHWYRGYLDARTYERLRLKGIELE